MARVWFLLGSLSALTAVALGAFGAHGLRSRVGSDLLGVFEVGVRYHMYHALALLATAWAPGAGAVVPRTSPGGAS